MDYGQRGVSHICVCVVRLEIISGRQASQSRLHSGEEMEPKICTYHRGNARFKRMLAWLLLADGVEHLLDAEQLDVVNVVRLLTLKTAQSIAWYIGRRINRAFAPWIDSLLEFRDILRTTDSIVSGSVALKAATDAQWPCNNLDIYVPGEWGGWRAKVLRFLMQHESYVWINQTKPSRRVSFYKYVQTITRLRRTITTLQGEVTMFINIIQSTGGAALPVASFSVTWCMNWIGADEIVVQYPEMTFAKEGVLNNPCRLNTTTSAIWFAKYESRGFHLMVDESRWSGCLEICFWRRSNEQNDGSLSLYTSTHDAGHFTPQVHWRDSGWKLLGWYGYKCAICSPHPITGGVPEYVRMYNEYVFSESDGV